MQVSGNETRWRQILGAILLFTLGFLAVASLLHALIRDTLYLHADMRSEKLAMLDLLKGQASFAAFGSSHIHNGFDPRAFDSVLVGSTAQTRSLNLAVMGGSQSEQRSMAFEFLRNLQAPPRKSACLVMLELNAGANLQNWYLVHPRSINIYDWATVRFISHLSNSDMSFTQHAGRTGFALLAAMLHYANVGMLSNRIFAPPVDPVMMDQDMGENRRGLYVLTHRPQVDAYHSAMIARERSHFEFKTPELYPGNYELVDQLAAARPGLNVSFVYFIYPKLSDLSGAYKYPDHIVTPGGHVVPIINLARPDEFPSFYQPRLWYDEAHLDGQGAEQVTAVFAQQLKAWYAAHGAPRACGG